MEVNSEDEERGKTACKNRWSCTLCFWMHQELSWQVVWLWGTSYHFTDFADL